MKESKPDPRGQLKQLRYGKRRGRGWVTGVEERWEVVGGGRPEPMVEKCFGRGQCRGCE